VNVKVSAINNDCLSESVTLRNTVLFKQLLFSLLARRNPAPDGTRGLITALTSSPLFAIMSQIDPFRALPPCIFKIYFSVVLPLTTSSSD
jgi:hypothetical protein